MIAKIIDAFMEFLFGFPVPPAPGGKYLPPAQKQPIVAPHTTEGKKGAKDTAPTKEKIAPPGEALGEDMPLNEVKAYHKNQNRYTRDELLDRAIEFHLLTGQWPTKAGSAGGNWHERWTEVANHVGLPA